MRAQEAPRKTDRRGPPRASVGHTVPPLERPPTAASVLALQRLAGNRAVASLASPAVPIQRRIGALGYIAVDSHAEVLRRSDGKRLFVVGAAKRPAGWVYGLGANPAPPPAVHAGENDDGFDLLEKESAHLWREEQLTRCSRSPRRTSCAGGSTS